MPGGDRTGPIGAGPLTGRGAGFCRGYTVPGYANPWIGGGFGRGRGFGGSYGRGGGGRGWRHRFYATGVPGRALGYGSWPVGHDVPFGAMVPEMTRKDEIAFLRDKAQHFKETLDDINRRLDELQNQREG
jgi:hypothetical protein